MDENVKALLTRLRGRMDMNARTATTHPDPAVRKASTDRYAAYATVLLDVELVFGVKWTLELSAESKKVG